MGDKKNCCRWFCPPRTNNFIGEIRWTHKAVWFTYIIVTMARRSLRTQVKNDVLLKQFCYCLTYLRTLWLKTIWHNCVHGNIRKLVGSCWSNSFLNYNTRIRAVFLNLNWTVTPLVVMKSVKWVTPAFFHKMKEYKIRSIEVCHIVRLRVVSWNFSKLYAYVSVYVIHHKMYFSCGS